MWHVKVTASSVTSKEFKVTFVFPAIKRLVKPTSNRV